MSGREGDGNEGQGKADGGSPQGAPRRLPQPTQAELRVARAAEKLRENLMRRKAQTRARRKGEAETGIGLPASQSADQPVLDATGAPDPDGEGNGKA